jgi:hypothetical protein
VAEIERPGGRQAADSAADNRDFNASRPFFVLYKATNDGTLNQKNKEMY